MKRACFIGRYSPPHNGHVALWKSVDKPVLILVRDTDEEHSAQDRVDMIKQIFEDENMDGHAMIVPDISDVFYGRGVGYNVKTVSMPDHIEGISATEIRRRIADEDTSWKQLVPKAVAEFIDSQD